MADMPRMLDEDPGSARMWRAEAGKTGKLKTIRHADIDLIVREKLTPYQQVVWRALWVDCVDPLICAFAYMSAAIDAWHCRHCGATDLEPVDRGDQPSGCPLCGASVIDTRDAFGQPEVALVHGCPEAFECWEWLTAMQAHEPASDWRPCPSHAEMIAYLNQRYGVKALNRIALAFHKDNKHWLRSVQIGLGLPALGGKLDMDDTTQVRGHDGCMFDFFSGSKSGLF